MVNLCYSSINHPHLVQAIRIQSDISATGANTVRVVLSNGSRWTVIQNKLQHYRSSKAKLACMLEVRDVTGSGEESAAGSMEDAAKFWLILKTC